ncbi:MAG: sugar ABC transporter ATP-binding protein [Pseudomonadota bacterium]
MSYTARNNLFFDCVEKHFGGTYALRDVSLNIERGEIVALLGENGAGKSTLIKILGGIHKADAGRVLIDGEAYEHRPGGFGERQSVAFIHQDLGMIEWMSVAENIALALGYSRKAGLISWRSVDDFAQQALDKVGVDVDPSTRVQELSRTEKSLVAIARALAVDCDFLVLDEPTASLPANEVDLLFSKLRPLKQAGVGMVYVSHRLDEIFKIADRVAVLRDGELVGLRAIEHTTPEELVYMIVGRKTRHVSKPKSDLGAPILQVSTLEVETAGPVNFDLSRNEIVGLVGLRGAGHEAVSRALFGAEPFTGSVKLDGSTPNLRNPETALADGVGLVARDRTEESVAMPLTIRENTFLNPAAVQRGLFSFLSPRSEAHMAARIGAEVALSPNDQSMSIESLSGGNQQKVVIGRWLETDRKLLICEDPTAGVDVGAKAEIYDLLNRAMERGVGIMVVSTDFEEVAAICHRAIVFSQGQIEGELSGAELTTENLIQMASASNTDDD